MSESRYVISKAFRIPKLRRAKPDVFKPPRAKADWEQAIPTQNTGRLTSVNPRMRRQEETNVKRYRNERRISGLSKPPPPTW